MAEAVPEKLWFESIEPRRMLYAITRFNEICGRTHHELQRRADLRAKVPQTLEVRGKVIDGRLARITLDTA